MYHLQRKMFCELRYTSVVACRKHLSLATWKEREIEREREGKSGVAKVGFKHKK